ncbi:MAG: glycosyltransferase family 4 protein [Christiangramia sp.]|uniref:glycosyltransferase family 4 protein n=1 Tax=Christiangramia sp. TaxID=1931228 RepID=UPI003241EB37
MRFSVFTHAEHYLYENRLYSYGPYVKEMNYWIRGFEEVRIIAPLSEKMPGRIDSFYEHPKIQIADIPRLHFKKNSFFRNLEKSLQVMKACFTEMKKADHIHLRCPGNTGMIAMIISSLLPSKPKTVKYAGNWDPKSEQPLSYRFQKWWLSNTFLTRNAKVLVYGNWENQIKNIIPFFTASFSETEKISATKEFKAPFCFIFCGSLVEGKNPLLALQIIHQLYSKDLDVSLDIYGDGEEMESILRYIEKHELENIITMHGNQPQEILKKAYQEAHFSILPSKSEGWPKALAEGMFFGCIPIGTAVSCVPWMLGEGCRGILLQAPPAPPLALPSPLNSPKGEKGRVLGAAERISRLLKNEEEMEKMSQRAREWSQQYTLERFRDEIHKLL